MTKPFAIPKALVWKSFQRVKANGGSAGVDDESIAKFEENLGNNLFKIWNRMGSGSYFPPPVKAVPIPKKSGGTRILGVPTVADRVAQTVVKLVLEPVLEPVFDRNSFGYRPGRSALDAVALVRRRSWEYDWVVEFDIKGLFDNIDHELLMRAVRKHCTIPWVLLYIERWLKAPMETDAYSGRFRPPIPIHSVHTVPIEFVHPFRTNPSTIPEQFVHRSGGIRPGVLVS